MACAATTAFPSRALRKASRIHDQIIELALEQS